ncbi:MULTISPECIES: LLM class flavin-dependent oxidoreductase [Mycobacterium]|uniref:LLM class flavin-dependent oxidoreductase n=1 Tax=Mycobacterium TaxID=1763 RepID=UPI001EF0C9EE|nr:MULTISPECIES: LLM class flavin-dependent oxidoreductase [Mycobacterium]
MPIVADRHLPASAFGAAAAAIAASGVVDDIQVWDQLTSWFPQSLWTADRSPLAALMADCDSFPDAFVMAAYGAAAAPGTGLVLSSDSVRRGPGELMQSLLTLANVYEGNAIFQIGAGELKQTQPFGHKRSQGIKRLEDLYEVFHRLWQTDGPISYDGHYAKIDTAWLGKAKNHRPQIWGMGGGPRIIDLATTHADGFVTMAPMVWNSAEEVADNIASMKRTLAEKGRDPEAFGFGIWSPLLIHEDANVIDRALDNDLMRWVTAIIGRINQGDWAGIGLEPPMPPDWHYAMKLLPLKVGEAEAMEIVGRTTRKHSEQTWLYGTPDQVARQLQPYVEAGVNLVCLLDILPFVLEVEDAMGAIARPIEVSGLLKQKVSADVPVA